MLEAKRLYRFAIVFVIAIAFLLRLSLALVNREANDNHIEVATIILNESRLPRMGECFQCFHPKLYHVALAGIISLFPDGNTDFRIKIANLVNCLAGLFTILILWHFVERLSIQNHVKFLAVSLAALNPSLIAINAQATNDTFVILFSVFATHQTYMFLKDRKRARIPLFIFSTILAILTKTNGIVIFLAIALALAIVAHIPSIARRAGAVLLPAFILFILFVPLAVFLIPLSQVRSNLVHYGTPAVRENKRPDFPNLFKKTYTFMAGVRSLADSFLTFRIFSLLQSPQTTYTDDFYPVHRTSYWAQVYARAHFVHFDDYPSSWGTKDPFVLNLGRAIFIFALFPTIVLLLGVGFEVVSIGKGLRSNGTTFLLENAGWFLLIAFAGYLSFVVLYSAIFRLAVSMKPIFFYPALLTLPYFFAKGLIQIENCLANRGTVKLFLRSVVISLLVLYLMDVSNLIVRLSN